MSARLCESAGLRGLAHLELSGSRLSQDEMGLLCENLQMPGLISLGFAHGWLGRQDITALVARGWFRNIRKLNFASNGYSFGANGLRALVSSENAAGLTSLDLSHCSIPANSLEARPTRRFCPG